MTTIESFVDRAKQIAAECPYTTDIIFARLYNGMKSLTALGPIPDTPEGYVIQDFGLGRVGDVISPQALNAWHTCVEIDGNVMTVKDPTGGSTIHLGPIQYVPNKIDVSQALGDDRLRSGYPLDD